MDIRPPLNADETKQRIQERLRRLMRGAALDVLRKVIMRNPVDSGYSRANWRMSVNEVDRSVSQAPTAKERAEHKDDKEWYPHQEPGDEAIGGVTSVDSIFVTNSVGYMRYLEEGSSKQAPAHFIKGVAQEVQSGIRKYIAEAKR